jgi:aminobenzoyl-glutamate utilization protein B
MTVTRFAALRYLAIIAIFTTTARATDDKLAAMKADLIGQIDQMRTQTQVMVDSIFSSGELGFQEYETQKYLTGILFIGKVPTVRTR